MKSSGRYSGLLERCLSVTARSLSPQRRDACARVVRALGRRSSTDPNTIAAKKKNVQAQARRCRPFQSKHTRWSKSFHVICGLLWLFAPRLVSLPRTGRSSRREQHLERLCSWLWFPSRRWMQQITERNTGMGAQVCESPVLCVLLE